ncbi:hypothetical protein RhiLY_10950 [Ceratobasidium sp. AG-Ba]|nr:hypothetical protein RhiLY_10950 [Ceratobasidium sp. AG-Ba]
MAAIRDEIYYSEIDTSRLANHSEVFKGLLELPTGLVDEEGGNDANPVKLVDLSADEFRSLLFIFCQRPWPVDPAYLSFMAGASDPTNQNPIAFKRYLDIAKLSNRFCMSEIEAWAQTQVLQTLNSSYTGWLTHNELLDVLSYFKICSSTQLLGLMKRSFIAYAQIFWKVEIARSKVLYFYLHWHADIVRGFGAG